MSMHYQLILSFLMIIQLLLYNNLTIIFIDKYLVNTVYIITVLFIGNFSGWFITITYSCGSFGFFGQSGAQIPQSFHYTIYLIYLCMITFIEQNTFMVAGYILQGIFCFNNPSIDQNFQLQEPFILILFICLRKKQKIIYNQYNQPYTWIVKISIKVHS